MLSITTSSSCCKWPQCRQFPYLVLVIIPEIYWVAASVHRKSLVKVYHNIEFYFFFLQSHLHTLLPPMEYILCFEAPSQWTCSSCGHWGKVLSLSLAISWLSFLTSSRYDVNIIHTEHYLCHLFHLSGSRLMFCAQNLLCLRLLETGLWISGLYFCQDFWSWRCWMSFTNRGFALQEHFLHFSIPEFVLSSMNFLFTSAICNFLCSIPLNFTTAS